jgi:hypothetical protein
MVLDAGGVITKTVNRGDDLVNGYYQNSLPPDASTYSESDANSWNYLDAIRTRKADTKPDYFFITWSAGAGPIAGSYGGDQEESDDTILNPANMGRKFNEYGGALDPKAILTPKLENLIPTKENVSIMYSVSKTHLI